ncbi:hypothetical protein GLOTRDRAFT_111348 [Gloeophyllum trabeum ATCC 11539]|uniref:RING-type domain-containing protein n=1 Tax=Gloeophyllum trabeum (strain ATCC 11539 / FP-39264 / Madison 617) TaxID=670483 RepID=S7Q543_GLOTA|nr:uncharacterized protein GLOTRDRAFT_111348 [Gloeophyllum trabeum ATCC 11539]EPQ54627.1 hypothetical protein GLOTRDRAFT_111348 [Gloeophyllum trabeum ATCC 11539]
MEHNNHGFIDFGHLLQNLVGAFIPQVPHAGAQNDQPAHDNHDAQAMLPHETTSDAANATTQSSDVEDREMTPIEELEAAASSTSNSQPEIVDREMIPAEPELDGPPPLEPIANPQTQADAAASGSGESQSPDRATSDSSSMPSLHSVSDSSSDTSSARDVREVEMMDATQPVDDDNDSNWTDVSSDMPPLEPITQPTRGPNRRVRVEEVEDDEDRPRSRQRTTGPAAANTEQGTAGAQAPHAPQGHPGMGFAFTINLNGVPMARRFGAAEPRPAQAAAPDAPAGGIANTEPPVHQPHNPFNPFEFFTLLGGPDFNGAEFLNLMGGIPPEQEQDDPERAKKLVDGMEVVPPGLVKRMERVGGAPGAHLDDSSSADAGADVPGCAICWDKLLDDDAEKDIAPPGEGESAASSDNKIVALPCAHVFHASCLIPWFSRPRHTTCPTCRFNVDPDNLTYQPRPRRRQAPAPADSLAQQPDAAAAGPAPATEAQPQQTVTEAIAPTAAPNPPVDSQPQLQAQPQLQPAQPQFTANADPQAANTTPNPRPGPRFFVQPFVTVDFNLEFGPGGPAPVPGTFHIHHHPPTQPTGRASPPPAAAGIPPVPPQQPQPEQAQPRAQEQGPAGPQPQIDTDQATAWLQWMLGQTLGGVPLPRPPAQPQEQQPRQTGVPPQPQAQQPQGPPPQPQPQPRGTPFIHGPHIFFGPPPPFDMGAGPRPAPRPREKREWTPPPPPGPTLRQRVEQKEREAGLRCDDVSCGLGPTDEDPIPCVDVASLKQVHIRPAGVRDEGARVCAHKFHPSCLVSAERVAGWGRDVEEEKMEEEKSEEEEVEVSCPVCRAVGWISGAEWEEGVRALA